MPKPGEQARDGAPRPAPSGAEAGPHAKPPTVPHPHTGVHSVHIHHMAGGRAMTHTHHEAGGMHPDEQEHNSLAEAHDHAQAMLPPEEGHQEPDGDEMAGQMSSLGGSEEV